MEESRVNHTEQAGINYELDHNHEVESQDTCHDEFDSLNGNSLLRQLLADEIAEGM